jgi:hypothetical protein
VVVVEGTLLNNAFIHSTGLIDLHCLHTLPRSIYLHGGKCLHALPRFYLNVAAMEDEEASMRGRKAAVTEEEAGMCVL